MTVDRSYVRVKAMLIAPNTAGSHHLVSVNRPTAENPEGYHRLIGGSVELGETHREAIIREVDEELGVRVVDLAHVGTVENIFRIDGELGHEVVALYSGSLEPEPAQGGGTLTESDGSIVPVMWRPFADASESVPLYPAAAHAWIQQRFAPQTDVAHDVTSVQQDDIDARIQTYYGDVFDEHARLTTRSPQGPVEFIRTQEIVRERLVSGRVLDIGGGAGIHARALQDAGFEVELIDPVLRHVEQARAAGVAAQVADARELPYSDAAFDAALMLGPLYHLASREDRLRAIAEAARVVRPGGFVFAAGLSRYIAFGMATLGRTVPEPFPGEWVALAAQGVPSAKMRFPAGHLHTAEELDAEVAEAGLSVIDVVGVEGPAGGMLESVDSAGEELIEAALLIARTAASMPAIRDMSAHLIAVARVPER